MKILLIIAVLAGLGYVGNEDYKMEVLAQEKYCSNVALWNATNGEQGHPAYKGLSICYNENQ